MPGSDDGSVGQSKGTRRHGDPGSELEPHQLLVSIDASSSRALLLYEVSKANWPAKETITLTKRMGGWQCF